MDNSNYHHGIAQVFHATCIPVYRCMLSVGGHRVSKWLNLMAFFGTADIRVHVVHGRTSSVPNNQARMSQTWASVQPMHQAMFTGYSSSHVYRVQLRPCLQGTAQAMFTGYGSVNVYRIQLRPCSQGTAQAMFTGYSSGHVYRVQLTVNTIKTKEKMSLTRCSIGMGAPSHYLNQCWDIVNWTFRNKH